MRTKSEFISFVQQSRDDSRWKRFKRFWRPVVSYHSNMASTSLSRRRQIDAQQFQMSCPYL